MSHQVYFDDQQCLVYARFTGIVTTSEVREVNHLIAGQDDSARMLIDASRMRMFDVSEDYLEQLGERMSTELPVRYRAIVVTARHYDQIEMFAAHASSGFRNVRAFTDIDAACHWLLINDTEQFLADDVASGLMAIAADEAGAA